MRHRCHRILSPSTLPLPMPHGEGEDRWRKVNPYVHAAAWPSLDLLTHLHFIWLSFTIVLRLHLSASSRGAGGDERSHTEHLKTVPCTERMV